MSRDTSLLTERTEISTNLNGSLPEEVGKLLVVNYMYSE